MGDWDGGWATGAVGGAEAMQLKVWQTLVACAVCSTAVVGVYYAVPADTGGAQVTSWTLAFAAVIFGAVFVRELVVVVRHDEPMRRAVVSLAVLVPLFIVLYARIYLSMSVADPGTFDLDLTKTSALYLTLTVLSTVGFGDITPQTDPARAVVMTQMIADVVLLAFGVRVLFHYGARAAKR